MQTQELKTDRLTPFIERNYREGGPYQWVRETMINSLEANATRIEYNFDRQAALRGHYRTVIEDNGRGMTPAELVQYFQTFGGGGKKIGGFHENYGIGSKTSLLPWNKYGVIVITWTKDHPEGSMIHILFDEKKDEYGLRVFENNDVCVSPFVDRDYECDWRGYKPEWIEDHGTVIVLLGNHADDTTIYGDKTKDLNAKGEQTVIGIMKYIQFRLWSLDPEIHIYSWGIAKLLVNGKIPREVVSKISYGDYNEHNLFRYQVYPLTHFVIPRKKQYLDKFRSGTVVVDKLGTKIHWFLWDGLVSGGYASPEKGFIGVLYANEIYNISNVFTRFREYGITQSSVRDNLFLIIEPPFRPTEKDDFGVYPTSNRNVLLWGNGKELPHNAWSSRFLNRLPAEIDEANKKATKETVVSTTNDNRIRKILQDLGSLWSSRGYKKSLNGKVVLGEDGSDFGPIFVVNSAGEVVPTPPHPRPIPDHEVVHRSPIGPNNSHPKDDGREKGSISDIQGDLPHCAFTTQAENFENGLAIKHDRKNPRHPAGHISVLETHPMISKIFERYLADYALSKHDEVRAIAQSEIGYVLKGRVAHIKGMSKLYDPEIINKMLGDEALTASLAGFYAEDSIIKSRLRHNVGKVKLKDYDDEALLDDL